MYLPENRFAPRSKEPKKPEAEMVGAILGEEGRREFEKKLGKKMVVPIEDADPQKLELTEEERESFLLKRAEKLLGRENVHGPKDVEFLLGFKLNPKDIPPIQYSEADFLKSREIKEKTGVEEMLVLFTKDQDGSPLTGEKLHFLIQKKYDEMYLGQLLGNEDDSYQDQRYYKKLGLQHEWKLITKQCIPDSRDKYHHFEKGDTFKHEDTQEYAIEQYAKTIGVSRAKLQRPEPFQMLDAVAIHLTATERDKGKGKGERLLDGYYHWSDSRSATDDIVSIGDACEVGAVLHESPREELSEDLGVCLSRDPS